MKIEGLSVVRLVSSIHVHRHTHVYWYAHMHNKWWKPQLLTIWGFSKVSYIEEYGIVTLSGAAILRYIQVHTGTQR